MPGSVTNALSAKVGEALGADRSDYENIARQIIDGERDYYGSPLPKKTSPSSTTVYPALLDADAYVREYQQGARIAGTAHAVAIEARHFAEDLAAALRKKILPALAQRMPAISSTDLQALTQEINHQVDLLEYHLLDQGLITTSFTDQEMANIQQGRLLIVLKARGIDVSKIDAKLAEHLGSIGNILEGLVFGLTDLQLRRPASSRDILNIVSAVNDLESTVRQLSPRPSFLERLADRFARLGGQITHLRFRNLLVTEAKLHLFSAIETILGRELNAFEEGQIFEKGAAAFLQARQVRLDPELIRVLQGMDQAFAALEGASWSTLATWQGDVDTIRQALGVLSQADAYLIRHYEHALLEQVINAAEERLGSESFPKPNPDDLKSNPLSYVLLSKGFAIPKEHRAWIAQVDGALQSLEKAEGFAAIRNAHTALAAVLTGGAPVLTESGSLDAKIPNMEIPADSLFAPATNTEIWLRDYVVDELVKLLEERLATLPLTDQEIEQLRKGQMPASLDQALAQADRELLAPVLEKLAAISGLLAIKTKLGPATAASLQTQTEITTPLELLETRLGHLSRGELGTATRKARPVVERGPLRLR